MEKERKIKLYDILIMLCVYLIACSIPLSFLFDNERIVNIIRLLLKLGTFVFFIIKIRQKNYIYSFDKKANILKYIPFLLICFGNFIAAFISKNNIIYDNNYIANIAIEFFSCIAISLCEETIFRYLLLNFIKETKNNIKSILISSLCFGAMHIVNITSLGSIPIVLVQCVYTFGIGLLFGFMYLDSGKIYLSVILHFLFNFINSSLLSYIYDFEYNVYFYVVNIIIAIVVGIYCYILYRRSDLNVTNDNRN